MPRHGRLPPPNPFEGDEERGACPCPYTLILMSSVVPVDASKTARNSKSFRVGQAEELPLAPDGCIVAWLSLVSLWPHARPTVA